MADALVEVGLTRDSVCMGDDIDAPHSGAVLVPGDASPIAIVKAIQRSGYLAYVGPNATWSVRIGAAEILFGTRHGVDFAWPVADEPGIQTGDIGTLFLTYHQQTDPEELLQRMQIGRP